MPSAQVVSAIQQAPDQGHKGFVLDRSRHTKEALSTRPLSLDLLNRLLEEADKSIEEQTQIEAADAESFERFRQDYMSPRHLVV